MKVNPRSSFTGLRTIWQINRVYEISKRKICENYSVTISFFKPPCYFHVYIDVDLVLH